MGVRIIATYLLILGAYISNEFKDKNNKESANKLMKLQKYSSAKN